MGAFIVRTRRIRASKLRGLGFLSRIVPLSYRYSIESVKGVFDYVLGLEYLKEHDTELERIPKQERMISPPR